MDFQNLLYIADAAESLTVLIAFFGYIPQWITLYRSKSSENINLSSWYVWFFGSACSTFYSAVHYIHTPSTYALLFSCAVSMIFVITTIAMIKYYSPSAVTKHPKAEVQLVEAVESLIVGTNEAIEILAEGHFQSERSQFRQDRLSTGRPESQKSLSADNQLF